MRPCLDIPTNLPRTQDPPEHDIQLPAATAPTAELPQTPDEEARDILAKAIRNQAEDGPSTRRAAIRAYKYLHAMVRQHGPQLQKVYEASKEHATRHTQQRYPGITQIPDPAARTPCCPTTTHVRAVTLLVHPCLTRGPWPKSPSTWTRQVNGYQRWEDFFFADEYVQRPGDPHTAVQTPEIQNALRTVKGVLADLELRVIEFFSEWLVALLMPARHVLETRSPHLSFMLMKDYWFKELYLGLKVAASLDRTESFIKTIEGQVRCITAEFKQTGVNVAWNVSYINVFIPAWMVPPVYHSLRREEIKCRNSRTAMGVKSLRPTWFEDETVAKTAAEPMHGLRLIIKEDVLPLSNHPKFEALEEVAKRGLLAPETWHEQSPAYQPQDHDRCASLRNSHRAEWRRMP